MKAFLTLIATAGLMFSAPTPTPGIITAASTVQFRFSALKDASGYHITGYEYFEKVGAAYVLLGTGVSPIFNVPKIGKKPRVFAIRALSDKGPSVMCDIPFPGAMAGVRYYVEVVR